MLISRSPLHLMPWLLFLEMPLLFFELEPNLTSDKYHNIFEENVFPLVTVGLETLTYADGNSFSFTGGPAIFLTG